MSKKSEQLEKEIEKISKNQSFNSINFESLQQKNEEIIEYFELNEHVSVIDSEKIGNQSHQNKTDVILKLSNDKKVKISIKLANADYFGNWYSHRRALQDFSKSKTEKLIKQITNWANKTWKESNNANLFVGVSVSFGMRTGNTQIDFNDVFDDSDIMKIIKGSGTDEDDSTANVIYISDKAPSSFEDLVQNLRLITSENVRQQINKFKIIFRPVNPMTSSSDRSKNSYTKFIPNKVEDSVLIINDLNQLKKIGKFELIDLNNDSGMNHNQILDNLFNKYNILIPRKDYYYYYLENNSMHVVYIDETKHTKHEIFTSDSMEFKKISNVAFSKIKNLTINNFK